MVTLRSTSKTLKMITWIGSDGMFSRIEMGSICFRCVMDDLFRVINDEYLEQNDENNLQNNQDGNVSDFSPFAHMLEAEM